MYDSFQVGQAVRNLREMHGMSVVAFCDVMDMSITQVYKVEEGMRHLRVEQIFKLMEVFGTDANTVLGLATGQE